MATLARTSLKPPAPWSPLMVRTVLSPVMPWLGISRSEGTSRTFAHRSGKKGTIQELSKNYPSSELSPFCAHVICYIYLVHRWLPSGPKGTLVPSCVVWRFDRRRRGVTSDPGAVFHVPISRGGEKPRASKSGTFSRCSLTPARTIHRNHRRHHHHPHHVARAPPCQIRTALRTGSLDSRAKKLWMGRPWKCEKLPNVPTWTGGCWWSRTGRKYKWKRKGGGIKEQSSLVPRLDFHQNKIDDFMDIIRGFCLWSIGARVLLAAPRGLFFRRTHRKTAARIPDSAHDAWWCQHGSGLLRSRCRSRLAV